MRENSNPKVETTEKTESCSKLRPICLRVPRGKNETMKHNCSIVDIKDMSYNTIDQLDRIAKYIDNTDTDTDIIDKFKIVEFVDKKSGSYVGDDDLQNCYSIELAWFIIIKDIMNNINSIIKQLNGTAPPPIQNDDAVPTDPTTYNNSINILTGSNPDLKSNPALKSNPDLNLFAIFKSILSFGIKKWGFTEIEITDPEIKLEIKLEEINNSWIKNDQPKVSIYEIIENNIDAKNHTIAYLLLHEFNKFINSKGFKIFSVILQYPELNNDLLKKISKEEAATKIPSEGAAVDPQNVIDCLSEINKIIKLTLLFMNEKKDLTNIYSGEKFNPNIYDTITGEFSKVTEFTNKYINLINENLSNEEIEKIEKIIKTMETMETQSGGSLKDEQTVIIGLALYIGKNIMNNIRDHIINGVLQTVLSSQIIYAIGIVIALTGPWGGIAISAALFSHTIYKLANAYINLKNSISNRYIELKKLLDKYDNKSNSSDKEKIKEKIITLFLKLQKQIVEEDYEDNKKKRDDAEKNIKKNINDTTKKLLKYEDYTIGTPIEQYKPAKKLKSTTDLKKLVENVLTQIKELTENEKAKEIKDIIPARKDKKEKITSSELEELSTSIETVNTFIDDMIIPDEAYRIDDFLLNKLDKKRNVKSIKDKEKNKKGVAGDDTFTLGVTDMSIETLRTIMDKTSANDSSPTKKSTINFSDKDRVDIINFKKEILDDLKNKFKDEISQLNKSLLTESQGGGLISSRKSYEIKHQQKNGRRRKYTLKKFRKRRKSSKHENSRRKIKRFKKKIHKSSGRKSSGRKSTK